MPIVFSISQYVAYICSSLARLDWQCRLINAAINPVLPSGVGVELSQTVDEVASVGHQFYAAVALSR